MNQRDAEILLVNLARAEPSYRTLSLEYGAVLPEDLPRDLPEEFSFAEQVLNLLRENPNMAKRIEQKENQLNDFYSRCRGCAFGMADILTPQLIVAVLVLLSVHFHIKREKNGKWSLEAGYKPLNSQALKPVLSVLAAIIGKVGKGLVELSETLDGTEDGGAVPRSE